MNSMTLVMLGLLTVSLTSGQMAETTPRAQGRKCYSCDLNDQPNNCLYNPYSLNMWEDNVTCPAGYQCYFTFYRMAGGQMLYGKRGCTDKMDTLPFHVQVKEGCQQGSGFQLCHITCGHYDFCNTNRPSEFSLPVSYAPRLQLSAWLMGSSLMMMVVTMIYTMLL